MTIDREWSMDINGEPFITTQSGPRQFRVTFDIDVRPGDAIALADISVYNLREDTVVARGSSVVFRAGFTNNIDVIFTGVVTNVFRERDAGSPEVRMRLLCRSGDAPARGSAAGSYGKGTKVVDVLRDLAQSWPARLDIDESQFDDAPLLTTGYIADGDIPTTLNSLGYAFEFNWVLDNGRIVVNRLNRSRQVIPTVVNQFTGMQGIPEVTRGPNGIGVFVAVRLDPSLRIYGQVDVQSRFTSFNTGNLYFVELAEGVDANGLYNIFSLSHRGDSHGNVWTTEIDGLRVDTIASTITPEPTADNGVLVWGQRVDQPFRVKVREIAANLNFDPNWIMSVIAFETGKTFDPGIKNPGGSATGLIQFTEGTAKGLGTTTAALGRMTAVEQLDYVQRYFEPYAHKVTNMGDCYMAVLWPIAINRPDTYVMWEQSTGPYQREYAANSGLDVDRDGKITRGEAVSRVNTAYREGMKFPK